MIRLQYKLLKALPIAIIAIAVVPNFLKAVGNNQTNAEKYYNQRNNYFSKGALDSAIVYYTKAIELNPKDAKVMVELAMLYGQKN